MAEVVVTGVVLGVSRGVCGVRGRGKTERNDRVVLSGGIREKDEYRTVEKLLERAFQRCRRLLCGWGGCG